MLDCFMAGFLFFATGLNYMYTHNIFPNLTLIYAYTQA
nr:MAG TPA: Photosystem II protein D1 1 II, Time resolved, Free [Inoviridae sp.]